jgi:hypothetical protein
MAEMAMMRTLDFTLNLTSWNFGLPNQLIAACQQLELSKERKF